MIAVDEIEPCSELDEFLDAVETARRELGFAMHEECFYRGHSDSKHQLLPGLYRHQRALGCDDGYICDIESALFYEFQARARELHGTQVSGWDVLQFMQHHGVPTRLLDWTETLGTALYFALLNPDERRVPCVWLLNPYAWNEHEWSRDLVAPPNLGWDADEEVFYDYGDLLLEPEFGFNNPVAIYPVQRSARLQSQRGFFTFHGDDYRPLEEFRFAPEALRCVRIGRGLRAQLTRFLEQTGIDRIRLFPDLDNLSVGLKERYIEKDAARFASIRETLEPLLAASKKTRSLARVVGIVAGVRTSWPKEQAKLRAQLMKELSDDELVARIAGAIDANIARWAP